MKERQLSLSVPNRWFEKRRDFFVRKVVDEFFTLRLSFQDAYLIYLECRNPDLPACSDFLNEDFMDKRRRLWDLLVRMVGNDNDKGPLWQLKDLCHMVWPEVAHERDPDGSLLDWLVGSIFHETMKLKENIYLLNRYGPAACRLKGGAWRVECSREAVRDPSSTRVRNIIDVNSLIRRAAVDAVSQMEHIAFLFNHTSYMLRLKMTSLYGNSLIIRLLLEREEIVRRLWAEEIENVFRDMFSGDCAEGFCVAGRSYLRGQWFDLALRAYERALAVNPSCDEALIKVAQLQAGIMDNRKRKGVSGMNMVRG